MSKDKGLVRPSSHAVLAGIKELQTFYRDGAKQVEASHPVYLDLPIAIANIAEDPWYQEARPYGRFQYRDEMYCHDEETDSLIYWPLKYRPSSMNRPENNVKGKELAKSDGDCDQFPLVAVH